MRVVKFENVRVLRRGVLRSEYLWVVDGKIVDPQARFWSCRNEHEHAAHQVVDGRGCILSPGFVDVQINGGYGVDFSDPTITREQIDLVAKRLVATGVTAFCPTLVSSRAEVYHALMHMFPRTSDGHTRRAANMLGVHVEGPFINTERKGAHDIQVLEAPRNGLASLEERYGSLDNVAIVTLAPELDGAMETIAALRQRGIVASAGHSQANEVTGTKAIDHGLSMLT